MSLVDIDWNPGSGKLRGFALVLLLFSGLIAWALLRLWQAGALAGIVLVIGIAASLAGLFKPRLIRPVYTAWMALGWPVAWVVSLFILAMVYFGVFTPLGLVLRAFGYDPLKQKLEPDAPTYWTAHQKTEESSRYFQQF